MGNLFGSSDIVQHAKGGLYKILRTPEPNSKLEYCNEGYYEYEALIDGVKWIRSQSEVQDGRFKLHPLNAEDFCLSNLIEQAKLEIENNGWSVNVLKLGSDNSIRITLKNNRSNQEMNWGYGNEGRCWSGAYAWVTGKNIFTLL